MRLLSHWFPHLGSEDIRAILDATAFALLGVLSGALWRWAQSVRYLFGHCRHTLLRYLTFRRVILLWLDTDAGTVQRLAGHLRQQLLSSGGRGFRRIRVHILRTPSQVLFYPARPSVVSAIILINTDVSKLSVDNKVLEKIQTHLLKYLERAGGIVGCHDLIYRRTRNERLRQAFGGKIEGFSLIKDHPIRYAKCITDHPIAQQMPERFSLKDGEVLATTGWPADAKVIFNHDSAQPSEQHPLVVARDYLTGRLVWLNSCDHQEPLCDSIQIPETDFVKLLSASVQWVASN